MPGIANIGICPGIGVISSSGYWATHWTTSNLVYEGHSFMAADFFRTALHQSTNVVTEYNSSIAGAEIPIGQGGVGGNITDRIAVVNSKIVEETVTNKNILVLYIGTNDLNTAGYAVTRYALLKTDVIQYIAAGWKVFAYTCTPATGYGKGQVFETERNIFNGLLKNDLALLSKVYILNTDTIAELNNPDDVLYYTDALHPTDLGYSLLANLFAVKIYSLSSLTQPVLGNEMIDQVAWCAVAHTYWNWFYSGWSADGAKLSDDGSNANNILGKSVFWEIGKLYKVIEIVNVTSGVIQKFNDFSVGSLPHISVSGTYSYRYIPSDIKIACNPANFVGQITGLSVKEIIYP